MIRIIELFGGIGAFSKAFKRQCIPIEVLDYVEINKYSVASYNAINDTNFEPQDITKWNKYFDDVDVIIHGSPCQDFSVAGRQAGGDKVSGTRSSLLYETLRIVEYIKPKYVIWENVKGILSPKHRHNFEQYLKEMSAIGYNNFYQVLNAKDYGIPQNRERVFTVSIRIDVNLNRMFTFPKPIELKYGLNHFLEHNVDKKYYVKKTNNIVFTDKRVHWDNSGKGYGSQQDRAFYINGLCNTIPTVADKANVAYKDLTAPNGYRIRRLTPREFWRLMGFDDEDFEKAKEVNSDIQLYKQAGNSIVVDVAEAIIATIYGGSYGR